MFHSQNKRIGTVNLLNDKTPSLTQHFIEIYKKLETQYENKASEDKLYQEAIEMLSREREMKKEEDEYVSISTAFKDAQDRSSNTMNINIKDIFKS